MVESSDIIEKVSETTYQALLWVLLNYGGGVIQLPRGMNLETLKAGLIGPGNISPADMLAELMWKPEHREAVAEYLTQSEVMVPCMLAEFGGLQYARYNLEPHYIIHYPQEWWSNRMEKIVIPGFAKKRADVIAKATGDLVCKLCPLYEDCNPIEGRQYLPTPGPENIFLPGMQYK